MRVAERIKEVKSNIQSFYSQKLIDPEDVIYQDGVGLENIDFEKIYKAQKK
jgi:hypothetical protein